MAAIIGAFLAGMALAEGSEGNHTMHKQMNGVTEFLVPMRRICSKLNFVP